jgi:hypothetical protein
MVSKKRKSLKRRNMNMVKHRAPYLAGVSSCKQYRRLIRTPWSEILSIAASVMATPSVEARIRTIRLISSAS